MARHEEFKARDNQNSSGDLAGAVERLARLSPVEYERERKAAAKKLGVRAPILERLVRDERIRLGLDGGGKDKEPAPALYEHWNVEPASEPIDGGIMLRALKEAIQRYVFMTEDQS